jgi:hypothetical protein
MISAGDAEKLCASLLAMAAADSAWVQAVAIFHPKQVVRPYPEGYDAARLNLGVLTVDSFSSRFHSTNHR